MKLPFAPFFTVVAMSLSLLLIQSCVDKEYDSDHLNTDVELNIPPVPLGGIDTIRIGFLPQLPPDVVVGARVVLTDTIRRLFDTATISKFFYEGSSGVVISAQVDAMVMPAESGLEIDLLMDIINNDGTLNKFVKIPPQKLTSTTNQTLEIRIAPEYMKYMHDARDLHFIFGIKVRAINFTRQDYLFFRELVLFAGGMRLEL